MSNIAVVMTTYAPAGSVGDARKKYAWESVVSLCKNLRGADYRLHIADDSSPDQQYVRSLAHAIDSAWSKTPSVSNSERKGIGGSLNLALDTIPERVWMYTTDDWLLTEQFDIEAAFTLVEKLGYDYVRLGPIHPHVMCSAEFNQEIGWWLHMYQKWGGYAFATRPFVASKEFFYNVGRFEERSTSYSCETDYNERVCKMEELKLACLPDISGKMWKHIGTANVGEPCQDFA